MLEEPVLTNLEAFQNIYPLFMKIAASVWILALVGFKITEADERGILDVLTSGSFRPYLSLAIAAYVVYQVWV